MVQTNGFKLPQKPMPLQFILVVPFLLQLAGTVGLLMLAAPESDVMAAIHQHLHTMIVFDGGAVALAIALGLLTARQLTAWLSQLPQDCAIDTVKGRSDRNAAAHQNLHLQDRLERLLKTSPAVLYTCNATGDYDATFVSENLKQLMGYEPCEFVDDSGFWASHLHPDDAPAVFAGLAPLFEQGYHTHEYRFRHQDGTYRWMQDGLNLVRDAAGKPTEIVGYWIDITDRKTAEIALQKSEERFREIANTIPQMFFVRSLNPDRYAYISPAYETIWGRSQDELLQNPWVWMEAIHPDDRDYVQASMASQMEGNNVRRDYRIVRPDGTIRWLSAEVTVIRDPDGKPLRFIGLAEDITDRKQLEQELVKHRDFRERLFDESSDALFLVDTETLLTLDCNQQAIELFEVPNKAALLQIRGQSLQKRQFSPEERISIRQEIQQKGFWSMELEYITHQGRSFWGELLAKRISFGDQQLDLVRLTDISDRKQAERDLQQLNQALEQRVQQRTQQLSQSEARLRLALMAANQGLYDLNVKTGEAIVSPEYALMLGYDPATFQETNATWIERLHPDDRELVAETYSTYIAGELSDYQVEFRQRTQQNQWKWILSVGKIVAWDEAGQPLRMLGTHTDIDDRKQAELALRESQRFLQTVIDTFPLGIFWKDCRSVYLGCNQKVANATGLASPADIIGKTGDDLPWSAAEADAYRADDREVLESGIAKLGIVETQVQADGSVVWLETNKLPLYSLNGDLIGVLGTYQDITDRKRAELALQQLNLELEQRVRSRTFDLEQAMKAADIANRAKSTFLANMSHELRTPLNAILGFTQLLRHDTSLSAEQQDYIRIMYRSGDHLLSLINDILDLSKIEAGHITLETTAVNLLELLRDLQEMFWERAEAKDLRFNVEVAPDVPQVINTDPYKLRQVCINLLNNAIKFTQVGWVTLQVKTGDQGQERRDNGQEGEENASLASHPTPATLVFEVEDTGTGIAPEDLATIFDAFAQAEAGRISLEGTGLGLAISRSIVSLLGGELTVSSTVGQGSTFGFFIPLCPVSATDVPIAPTQGRVIAIAPDQPVYRILVVDDQPDNRKLLAAFCTRLGLAVQEAASGEAAIALWQAWHPHLIWMDIRMPDMDGCETTRRIRAAEAAVQSAQPTIEPPERDPTMPVAIPILALTAQAEVNERTRALAAGCNDVVSKPVHEETLLVKMADYLGLRYQFEESSRPAPPAISPPTPPAIVPPLTPHILRQTMPSTWLTALHQAALRCDEEDATDLIQQIPASQTALLEGLTRLVRDYQFEVMMQLTQPETQPPSTLGLSDGLEAES